MTSSCSAKNFRNLYRHTYRTLPSDPQHGLSQSDPDVHGQSTQIVECESAVAGPSDRRGRHASNEVKTVRAGAACDAAARKRSLQQDVRPFPAVKCAV
jgi:hypothetical protein